jgi:nucleoside-diphosphate-sugar epimerase
MKILIAGGAGYIGSALVPKLIDRGYEVEVVDLCWFGRHLPWQVKVQEKDVLQITEAELRGFEQVIFLAGISNDPMAEFSPAQNFVGNAAAPAFLAYTAKRAGVKRFIHSGSCSVYGYAVDALCDEDSPATCTYPYGISKLQGEKAVMQLADPEFSVISFRKGTVSGYSPRMRFDLVVNAMFRSVLKTGTINVNNPTIWRPILAVQDAVSAYVRAVEAPPNLSGIFNISSGNYTVGEIADLVKTVLEPHGVSISVRIQHRKDFRSYKVSDEKARNVLSFKPRFTVETIVEELWENRQAFPNLDDPEYFNIQIFQRMNLGGPA